MPNQTTASEIQTIFNRIAPVYDQMNDWLSLGQHRIWKLMTVKWVEPQPGDRGLDICCGSGDLTRLLAKKIGSPGETIGLDFSADLLAVAKENSPNLPITWIEGDALNLPFEDNYFNCATIGYGLRNVTNIPLCLKELFRILKPSSKAAILDFHQPSQPFMQLFQSWYLENIVVPTAQHFGVTEEYAYIAPSVERFPKGEKQVSLALEAGFVKAIHFPLAGGTMGILVLEKA
ncbi:MAG: bifunctional demethylmenaquinone methyltransferase/2-methoxy-6-polyprenyl-1,4-benzoquinol methylase UbiE [Spirulinaceae cyanobacterium]